MGKKAVAFVPIKLNSQRLPHKNILPLGGRPLCSYIFETLLAVERIDEVYVFCSDENIINFLPAGVRFLKRDRALDGDLVQGHAIYQSFIEKVDSDVYVLAHTTSPFLRRESLENALDSVLNGEYDSALSVQKKQTFAWHNGKPLNYELDNIPRTQDIKPVYIETSGFFIFEKNIFSDFGRRIGFRPFFQEVDDVEAIDIDTGDDFEFASRIIRKNELAVEVEGHG